MCLQTYELIFIFAFGNLKFVPGMKVYLTDEKELIMEPCIKWAGNPNVTVAVKAFGLKATVQVCCCAD